MHSSEKVRPGRQGRAGSTKDSSELQIGCRCSGCAVPFALTPSISQNLGRASPAYQLCLTPGGYWYNCCTDSNLNGVYYRLGEHRKHMDGISWYGWHGANYSLKRVEMKIRPEAFTP